MEGAQIVGVSIRDGRGKMNNDNVFSMGNQANAVQMDCKSAFDDWMKQFCSEMAEHHSAALVGWAAGARWALRARIGASAPEDTELLSSVLDDVEDAEASVLEVALGSVDSIQYKMQGDPKSCELPTKEEIASYARDLVAAMPQANRTDLAFDLMSQIQREVYKGISSGA